MIVVLLSAIVTWAILYILVPRLRLYLLDCPNTRSSHDKPTPRGGGLAFVLVAFVCSSVALIFSSHTSLSLLLLLAVPLAIVGLLDDRFNLSKASRYFFQLLTAALLFYFSPLSQSMSVAVLDGNLIILPCV